MVARISIAVASARGVADRWRKSYQNDDGSWDVTVSGDSRKIYEKLCALGHTPDVNAVAKVIGNKTWGHLTCCACSDEVERAADFRTDWNDQNLILCGTCVREAFNALSSSSKP